LALILNSGSKNFKFFTFLLIIASFLLFFSPLPRNDSLGFIGILIGILIVLIFSSHSPAIKYALFIAFALRVSLILIYKYSNILPQFTVFSDIIVFEQTGLQFANNGFQWLFSHFTSGTYLYSWFIGLFYVLLGESPFLMQVINAILGTTVVWIVYSTAVMLWGEKEGKYASWIIAIFPSMVFFSSFIFREEPIIFTYSLGVFFLVKWQLTRKSILYIFSILLFALSLGFHTGMLPSLIIPVLPLIAYLYSSLRVRKYKYFTKESILLLLSIVLIFAILATGWGMDKIGSSSGFSFNYLSGQEETASRGRAIYLGSLSIKGPLDVVWQTPIRIFYFLFSPFIWMIKTPLDALGFFDTLLYILLCWGIFMGLVEVWRNKNARIILIFLLFEIIVFSLTTSNYGTALRHRAKLVPLFVLLIAANFEKSYSFIIHKVLKIKVITKRAEDEN
jgi:4-amino-4-deoxy-L-arabinose transferase-like glycosyltransferase